jgi:membrane peptidoglycan carboxypeptidase
MSAQNPPRGGLLSAVIGIVAFSAIAGLLVTAMVTPAVAISSVTAQSAIGIFNNLPTYIEIGSQPQVNTIYATKDSHKADGNVAVATVFSENRQEVSWDKVSNWAKDAAVDGEDRRFYDHGGVDPTGVLRALLVSARGGDRQGASTIAQQLVKNILIQQALQIQKSTPAATEKAQKAGIEAAQAITLDRKLKEMKLAISLEKKYTKKQVLLAYLNIAGFGGTTYGIQSAAQRYFNVDASQLSIVQAATLIAIVQEPTARAPISASGYLQNTKRRNVILEAMLAQGDITQAQETAATNVVESPTTVSNTTPKNGCIAANKYSRWYCDYVTKLVPTLTSLGATKAERLAAWTKGGYSIYTSLNLKLQTREQNVVHQYVPTYSPLLKIGAVADSVQAGTGRILTMAENKNFNDSQIGGGHSTSAVNYSTDFAYGGSGGFQTGSTYKAFTLIDWLDQGHGLNEIVNGTARTVDQSSFKDSCGGPWGGPYKFMNDEGEKGPFSIMTGTARSINGVFISMAQQLDLCDIKNVAVSLGVHTAQGTQPQTNPSSVLGTNTIAPLTMAAAYAGIADNGNFCEPTAVDSIVAASGKTLPGQARVCTQAVDPGVDHAALHALLGPLSGAGTGAASNPDDGVATFGKTGTTNGSVQTWTVGGSNRVATAVWVGNSVGTVALRATDINGFNSSLLRHPIFHNVEIAVDQEYPGGRSFPAPPANLLNGTGKQVPNVIGLSVAAATALLQADDFKVKLKPAIASAQTAGTIARVDPGVGTLLSAQYTIDIFPSDGSHDFVPDVTAGGPNNYAAARNILINAGFSNVVMGCKVTTDPSLYGNAVGTNPPKGKGEAPSKQITVYIGQALPC